MLISLVFSGSGRSLGYESALTLQSILLNVIRHRMKVLFVCSGIYFLPLFIYYRRSASFVIALGSMAFLLLSFLYLIIDVKELWSGAPFIYPGRYQLDYCHYVSSTMDN